MKIHHEFQQPTSQVIFNEGRSLLSDFKESCSHWLLFALHSCSDLDSIQSGFEAINCLYRCKIDEALSDSDRRDIVEYMEEYIDYLLGKALMNNNSFHADKIKH